MRTDGDGKPVRFTPVWVVVSDRVPVRKDGSLDGSSVIIDQRRHKIVLDAFIAEKAAALFSKTGSYRTLNNGGDAAEVFEQITGFPAKTVDLARDPKTSTDKTLADQQFESLVAARAEGRQFVLGSWGNNKPVAGKSLAEQDSITAIINGYPQYDPAGRPLPKAERWFKPGFVFQDGTGSADHSAEQGDSRLGNATVGDHDFTGITAVSRGRYKGMGFDGECPIVELRNPWSTVRPAEFSDGRATDDGIIRGPWYVLRTLIGSITIGGRPTGSRAPISGLVPPTLPPDAVSSFQLMNGETRAVVAAGDSFENAPGGHQRRPA